MYLVALKMSSNFFLRVCPSARGQLLSSWCTKMTFSSTACSTRASQRACLHRAWQLGPERQACKLCGSHTWHRLLHKVKGSHAT